MRTAIKRTPKSYCGNSLMEPSIIPHSYNSPPPKGGVVFLVFFWFLVPVFFFFWWLVSARTVPRLQAVEGKM